MKQRCWFRPAFGPIKGKGLHGPGQQELEEENRKKHRDMEQLVEAIAQDKLARASLYGEDGGAAGALGGRPQEVIVGDRRGRFNKEDLSNRIYPGQARRRQDVEPWEGLAIIQYMDKKRAEFADEDSYWRAVVMRYRPRTKKQLQDIYAKKEVFEARVKSLNLAKTTKRSKRSTTGISGAMQYHCVSTGGCRRAGAGRHDEFKDIKEQMKAWAVKERQHGHSLNAGDLWQEFKFLVEERIRSNRWKAGSLEEGSTEQKRLKVECGVFQERIDKVQASAVYMRSFRQKLVAFAGMRLLKPQRLVNLSPLEEHVRCELTWQM